MPRTTVDAALALAAFAGELSQLPDWPETQLPAALLLDDILDILHLPEPWRRVVLGRRAIAFVDHLRRQPVALAEDPAPSAEDPPAQPLDAIASLP